jgi:hypothetical protein
MTGKIVAAARYAGMTTQFIGEIRCRTGYRASNARRRPSDIFAGFS